MGIQNRDYYREDRRPSWNAVWGQSGYKWLIAINVAVFLLQLFIVRSQPVEAGDGIFYTSRVQVVTEALDLNPTAVIHGEVWRLLTYAFCHDTGNLLHIVFNMLFLAWLGSTLEAMYGTREFVLFYLVAAVVSGLTFMAIELLLHNGSPAIGASGAVLAVTALYALHFPRQEVFLFGLIRMQIRFLVLMYLIFDLLPVLSALSGQGGGDGIAHAAHLGGLVFGYVYYRSGMRLERLSANMNLKRIRPKRWWKHSDAVRIYQPPQEMEQNLDRKVDVILEKIQEHGESSLTDHERELLRKASERYKGNQRNR